jgi:uncharacterized membrane protein
MMSQRFPHYLALAGLAALMGILLLPSPSAWTLTISVPLLLLLVTGLKPPPRWGGWVAVLMIPYLCVAVGELIANPTGRIASAMIVGCTVLVLFAAIDFVRRTGASLWR